MLKRHAYFAAILLIAGLFCLTPAAVLAQNDTPQQRAIDWIKSQQQDDGAFPGFGPGDTADVVLALVAAGEDPTKLLKAGKSPLDYLQSQAPTYIKSGAGAISKLILAATATGHDPRLFGTDLPAALGSIYNADTGQYGGDVTGHCLALTAIKAMGATPPAKAFSRLEELQLADGGWSFDGSEATGSDTNTAAVCIEALVANAHTGPMLDKAVAYLRGQQNDDKGFPYSQTSAFGNESDVNSTALALRAFKALGEDTKALQQALESWQNANGSFPFQASAPEDNPLASYQAALSLFGGSLPLKQQSVAGVQSLIGPAEPQASLPNTGAAEQLWLPVVLLALIATVSGFMLRRRSAH